MAEKIVPAGLEATYEAIGSEGLEFTNSGSMFIHAKAAASDTLTIVTPFQAEGLELADREIVMGTGDEVFVGPFSRQLYNDSTGKVKLLSANEEITVAILTL